MPRERSQTEKDKHHMSNPNRSKPLDTENKLMGGGRGMREKGQGIEMHKLPVVNTVGAVKCRTGNNSVMTVYGASWVRH